MNSYIKRVVSRVQHFTGSRFRGLPQDIDRAAIARALKDARRLTGAWTDGANAVQMLMRDRDGVRVPSHDYTTPSTSGRLTHCATRN